MADRIFGTIETQINDGLSLTSINTSGQSITTYQQGTPQIQTVIENGVLPLASVINAPFVEVTSVNGMTGDVTVDAQINAFKPNYYYLKDSVITYNGKLYFAKQTFTSGSSFNANDWDTPDISQQQSNWTENDNTKPSFILNKPALSAVSTSGDYNDLSNTPNLASVALSGSYNDLSNTPSINNGQLTIQQNGQNKGSFTANQSTNTNINLITPTKTSQLTNDSGYITRTDNLEPLSPNLTPITDTPTGWIQLLGQGHKWNFYNQANVFPNQPAHIGQLESYITGNDLLQIWHSQADGLLYYRSGNSTGWYGDSSKASTWRKMLDDSQTNMITYDMMNWNTMGPTWSTFINTSPADNPEWEVFTKKGTRLVLKVANGGSWFSVLEGAENIHIARLYNTVQFSTSNAGDFGVGGLANNSTLWTRSYGSANNGTVANQAEISNTTGSTTYTSLLTNTGNRSNTVYECTMIRMNGSLWRMFGKISCAGIHSTLSFDAQGTATTAGTIPTIYQRGASVNNIASTHGVLEVLED